MTHCEKLHERARVKQHLECSCQVCSRKPAIDDTGSNRAATFRVSKPTQTLRVGSRIELDETENAIEAICAAMAMESPCLHLHANLFCPT